MRVKMGGSQQRAARVWAGAAVLLIAAVAILPHANDLSIWFDEQWSVFMIAHPWGQMLRERELNWPPGYLMLLKAWSQLASANDFALHTLGALVGLLGTACAVQAGRTLHSWRAGWLAGLAFGTSGYAIYFLLEMRGYGPLLALLMALVWLQARWLRRPNWQRAVPYVLVQIAVLYMHFTGGLVLALAAVWVAASLPPRQWPRWIAVEAVVGVAFLPVLQQFWDSYQLRRDALRTNPPGAHLLHGPGTQISAYSLHHDVVWAALVIVAAVGVGLWLWRRRRSAVGPALWLALWGVGLPMYAYLSRESQGLYSTRYLVYTLPALLLLIAVGLASLPRRGWIVGGILLLVMASYGWRPFDHRPRYSDSPPVRDLVIEMARRFEPGDVLVIDPGVIYEPLAWWYYEGLYFQGGTIPRAENGQEAGSRVWNLVRQGSEDPDLLESVQAGRIPTEFWGPWYFIATLYEGPPLAPGLLVGDVLRFGGGAITSGDRYLPGDRLTVESWWTVDAPPDADYSISLQVIGPDGRPVAQIDSGPSGAFTPDQTSAWQPGGFYRDDRSLRIPHCLPDR